MAEGKELKGWFQKEKKVWMKQPVYPWIIEMKIVIEARQGLGVRTPETFPLRISHFSLHPFSAPGQNPGHYF